MIRYWLTDHRTSHAGGRLPACVLSERREEMLEAIDEKQPEHMQLGPLFFKATETPRSEIKVGDKVVIRILDHDKFAPHEVIGYGADRLVNGQNVKGIPYIDYWGGDNPETNINNYLLNESYRVL